MTLQQLDYPDAAILMHCETDAERSMRLVSCAKERETVDWLVGLGEGGLWDVGANCGAYTLVAASLRHAVWAFEPAYQNYARLCQNILANPRLRHNIVPLPIALGNMSSVCALHYSSLETGSALHAVDASNSKWLGSGFETLDTTPGKPKWAAALPVLVMSGAHLVMLNILPAPKYVKVDVDGGELAVCEGIGEVWKGVESCLVEVGEAAWIPVCDLLRDYGLLLRSTHPRSEGSGATNLIFSR